MTSNSKKMTSKYFPHLRSRGSRMFVMRDKFGNDAYVCWYMLLEELREKELHVIMTSNKLGTNFLKYFAGEVQVEQEKIEEMINELALLSAIDKEFWQNYRVIYSQEFVDSLAPLYSKNISSLPTRNKILDVINGNYDVQNDPIKLNQTKLNNTKTKSVPLPFLEKEFSDKWEEWIEYKKSEFRFSFKSEKSLVRALNEIVEISKNNYFIAIKIIDKAMKKGWRGLFPLTDQDIRELNGANQSTGASSKKGTPGFNPSDLSRLHEFANQNDEQQRTRANDSGS